MRAGRLASALAVAVAVAGCGGGEEEPAIEQVEPAGAAEKEAAASGDEDATGGDEAGGPTLPEDGTALSRQDVETVVETVDALHAETSARLVADEGITGDVRDLLASWTTPDYAQEWERRVSNSFLEQDRLHELRADPEQPLAGNVTIHAATEDCVEARFRRDFTPLLEVAWGGPTSWAMVLRPADDPAAIADHNDTGWVVDGEEGVNDDGEYFVDMTGCEA